MSTMLTLPYDVRTDSIDRRARHTMKTMTHTWVCYQVNCDNVHHYWRCSGL
jgi:hypothetical protein